MQQVFEDIVFGYLNKFQKNSFGKKIYNFLIRTKYDSRNVNNNNNEELSKYRGALTKAAFHRLESEEDEDSWLSIDFIYSIICVTNWAAPSFVTYHFFLGLFSFSLSSSWAKLNYLAMFLMAGFPSSSSPLGSLPSGAMFLILSISSDSSFKTVNILFIFATDYIFPLINSLFFTFA